MIKKILNHFENKINRIVSHHGKNILPRIGAELKFPLVNLDGTAVTLERAKDLWTYLSDSGWIMDYDSITRQPCGAIKPGTQNNTIASCETGYCKSEFSLAHVADLFELDNNITKLCDELHPFTKKYKVRILGYGIQPISPPSEKLLIKKTRTKVWDKVFGSNRCLRESDGDDVCLFTINASSHVHISLPLDRIIKAVNVLNGFSGAQIALTANSNIWRGRIDPDFKCVSETLWDMWVPDGNRFGVPDHPFIDLKDYIQTITSFKPIYIRRSNKSILITQYGTFLDYFQSDHAVGYDLTNGKKIIFKPKASDVDLHNTCYWFNARISGYFTVENRTNDQQPPEDILTIPALTTGLVYALDEGMEVLNTYNWEDLRYFRTISCKSGMTMEKETEKLFCLISQMLQLAELGLRRRKLGEERYLEPLWYRFKQRKCPADNAAKYFTQGGIKSLIEMRDLNRRSSTGTVRIE